MNERVLQAIAAERKRQDMLWGPNEERRMTAWKSYAILAEEAGEVAEAMNDSMPDELWTELVHVAAVVIAWLERIEIQRMR